MAEHLNSDLARTIVGHKKILNTLQQAQRQGRLPSTLLFVGPEGVGRKKVALALAQTLVCENPHKESEACGQCGPCLRMAKIQSEALLLIQPEKNTIKIEQANLVLEFLYLRSISKARVVIIDSAQLMNPTAANSLLKILEEPPKDVYFILIAPSAQSLLPTLRSRSQVIRFHALNPVEMKKKSIKAAASPEWALRASQGSFSRLAGFQDEDELAHRDSAARFLELWIHDRKAFVTPEWRGMVKDRSGALGLTRYCALILRDAVFAKSGNCLSAGSIQGNSAIINIDKVELLSRLVKLDLPQLHDLSRRMTMLESGLQMNRDTQLAFEEFWLT